MNSTIKFRDIVTIVALVSFSSISLANTSKIVDDNEANCEPFVTGLPSLQQVQYARISLSHYLDDRKEITLASEQTLSEIPTMETNIKRELVRKEEQLVSFTQLYFDTLYYFMEGREEQFSAALQQLEEASLLDVAIDDHNKNTVTSHAINLLKVYGNTDFSMVDVARTNNIKRAIEVVLENTEEPAQKAMSFVIKRTFDIKSDLLSAQIKLATALQDKDAIDRMIEEIEQPRPEPNDQYQIIDSQIALGKAHIARSTVTGEYHRLAAAAKGLLEIDSLKIDRCNALIIGKAALTKSQLYYVLAENSEDENLKREYLNVSSNNAQIARRLLEKLHFPSLWREAHMVSADIYEQYELIAIDLESREMYRELKTRSYVFARSG